MQKPINRKAPCYRCTEREAGCHAKCERYGEWAKAQRAKLEAKHKDTYVYHKEKHK